MKTYYFVIHLSLFLSLFDYHIQFQDLVAVFTLKVILAGRYVLISRLLF